jgi:protein-disulfide isomerase
VRGSDDAGENEVVRVELGDTAGLVRGAREPLVTIVEYSDFQCPFCARIEPTLDRIVEDYEGKVRVVWKDFPLAFHDNAVPAALAAREARAQGRFWEMQRHLFANQGALDRAGLEKAAAAVGLDLPRFRAALDRPDGRAQVEADVAAAARLGVRGTPTFFINGRRLVGAQPYERWKVILDEEVRKAEGLLAKGTPRAKLYEVLMKGARNPEAVRGL